MHKNMRWYEVYSRIGRRDKHKTILITQSIGDVEYLKERHPELKLDVSEFVANNKAHSIYKKIYTKMVLNGFFKEV